MFRQSLMPLPLVTDDGRLLDAHYDIEGDTLILHSRGGRKGPAARNTAYGEGLRLILTRFEKSGLTIDSAWVDSSAVRNLPIGQRIVLNSGDFPLSPDQAFTLASRRMKTVGAASALRASGGNSTRKLRLRLVGATPSLIRRAVDPLGPESALKSGRLPTQVFDKVTAEHVWRAVEKLKAGAKPPLFGPSVYYDLVTNDGDRLPPKQVFAIAAADALGYPVAPDHFSGGLGTPCFRILEQAGYMIVAKGEQAPLPPPLSAEDREWIEGGRRMISHLRSERASGLGEAKKANFIARHGRLFCELCGLDPVDHYGDPLADSCIEAHHSATTVEMMACGHRTRLEDLQCLCANCHRLEHRRLKEQAKREAHSSCSQEEAGPDHGE